jgi:sRNA-binding protein
MSRQPVATSPMTVIQPPPASNPLAAAAPITLDRNSEARRAYRESRTAIALLQQRWPAAFPETPQQIRPLIAGLTPLIAATLDWSHPYTRAVLRTWKLRPAYCHAVLAHPVRFDLDGNPTDQPVGEDARTMAKTRLDTWASKRRQPTPHKPPGGGDSTTASSPTQASDRRKPAGNSTAPASNQYRSKSPRVAQPLDRRT